MASGIRVTVKRNRLPEIAKQLPITADVIVNERRGPEMRDLAKGYSRVDTGEMRDGWVWIRTSSGSGRLQNDVAHTPPNEYGTINMSAQPMARPAAEQVLPEIVDDFKHLESLLQ